MKEIIEHQIASSIKVKEAILKDSVLIKLIEKAAQTVVHAYRSNHKTLVAGNGGSAADAQHIAGEFVSRFYFDGAFFYAVHSFEGDGVARLYILFLFVDNFRRGAGRSAKI